MKHSFPTKVRIFLEISFLYFLQGVPYGFQVKYLPLLMRHYGHELSIISFMNLVSLPWILKFTWATLFERFQGYERLWISGCLILLSLTSLLFHVGVAIASLLPLLFLLLSFLSASLDIAVDSLAMRSFDEEDLGYCNIGHIVGYKVGILFGGGMLSVFNAHISLHTFAFGVSLVYSTAAVYFSCNDSALFKKNALLEKSIIEDRKKDINGLKETAMWMISTPEQMWLIAFVFLYKMGEQGFVSIYPLKLIDEGMKLAHIGMVTGIVGQISSIAGSSFGGFIISRYRIELKSLLLWIAFCKWMLLMAYSFYLKLITSNVILHAITESGFQLLAGMMTTTTFTAMMVSSKRLTPDIQTFHFTILSACEVLGKLCMKSSAGTIAEHIGYYNFFVSCCSMDFLLVLVALRNKKSNCAEVKQKND